MQELTLDEEILLQVEQPARYIGGETNSVKKDPDKVRLRFTMCSLDIYEISMNRLGVQILYNMFNRREDVYYERVFSPRTDLDRTLREGKIPPFTLESQRPVWECDLLSITLQYKMCYANILQVLKPSEIPLRVADRSGNDPVVIGDSPCTYNLEPIAPFFSLFYMGEGEVIYDQLLDLYLAHKEAGGARSTFLKKTTALPGIYVPSLYEPRYREGGALGALEPLCLEAPMSVRHLVMSVPGRADFINTSLVPLVHATQDRSVLELMRGCIRGYHFCRTENVYHPQHEHSIEYLKRYAEELLKITGNEEVSFSSLSSNDYSRLQESLEYLIQYTRGRKINIPLPSLHIDAFSPDVMQRIQDVKRSSLTFASGAGTQRLRDIINKDITEEDIMRGASSALHGGWTKVKFYFILRLPTETEEDRKGIPDLCERVAGLSYDGIPKGERVGRVQISASSSFFVSKPSTPFQWTPMHSAEEYKERARFVKEAFKQEKNWKSLCYQYHDVGTTLMEGVFARDNRHVADVIERAYRDDVIYDAWIEYFDAEHWASASTVYDVDPDFYTQRTRSTDELLPWDFIDCGMSKEFLKHEWGNTLEGKVTPNCREHCSGCNATSYRGGVCLEDKN